MEAVKTKNIVTMFLHWYFLLVPKKILATWQRFLTFGWHYFSIGLLLRSLLAPWKRDVMARPAGIAGFFEALVINIFTRCLGAFIRLLAIAAGLLFELLAVIFGIAVFVLWLVWSILSVIILVWGITLLI